MSIFRDDFLRYFQVDGDVNLRGREFSLTLESRSSANSSEVPAATWYRDGPIIQAGCSNNHNDGRSKV